MEVNLETIAINFIKTLQNRNSAQELSQFYHPEIEQIEFPNTVTKNKAVRSLNDLKQGGRKRQKCFTERRI
ncbi:MAG TPA: hypothetical protein VGI43_03710 [Mucilaginibacter sp.]